MLGSFCYNIISVGQAVAGESQRKVRAPKSRVPGNTWEVKTYGKCYRNKPPARVRVKGCGKSAPQLW